MCKLFGTTGEKDSPNYILGTLAEICICCLGRKLSPRLYNIKYSSVRQCIHKAFCYSWEIVKIAEKICGKDVSHDTMCLWVHRKSSQEKPVKSWDTIEEDK